MTVQELIEQLEALPANYWVEDTNGREVIYAGQVDSQKLVVLSTLADYED